MFVAFVFYAIFLSFKPMQRINAMANAQTLPSRSSTFVPADGSQRTLNGTMSLTLVAANGSVLVLNATDIAALPSYTGYGGFKNVLGNLKALGNYTGVPLNALCNLVGGINADESVNVSASDGYYQIFTYAQVDGDFVTYDNTTGQQVSHNKPLVPILAYWFNGANLSSDTGPLRLTIVGPEGLCTDSVYWVYKVVQIKIIETNVPEFSPLIILPLLLLITLIAALSSKLRRHSMRLANKFDAYHFKRHMSLGSSSFSKYF